MKTTNLQMAKFKDTPKFKVNKRCSGLSSLYCPYCGGWCPGDLLSDQELGITELLDILRYTEVKHNVPQMFCCI